MTSNVGSTNTIWRLFYYAGATPKLKAKMILSSSIFRIQLGRFSWVSFLVFFKNVRTDNFSIDLIWFGLVLVFFTNGIDLNKFVWFGLIWFVYSCVFSTIGIHCIFYAIIFSNSIFYIIYLMLYFLDNLQIIFKPYEATIWFSLHHEISSLSKQKLSIDIIRLRRNLKA